MKEPQNADPETATALDLKIAGEACALSAKIATDLFFGRKGTNRRRRGRYFALRPGTGGGM